MEALKEYLLQNKLFEMDEFIDYYLADKFVISDIPSYEFIISVSFDYGASEGIYIDAILQYYDKNELFTRSCLTVKTLQDEPWALEKMALYAARIKYSFPIILRKEAECQKQNAKL